MFEEKYPSEPSKVSLDVLFCSLGRFVGGLGQQCAAILQRPAAHKELLMLSCDFVCQDLPQVLAGGMRPAGSGPQVEQHVGLQERGLTQGKRTSEQNGYRVTPTVMTKVTYCTLKGSFTGNSCRDNFLGEGGTHCFTTHPTRQRWHGGELRAAADLRATPPASGAWKWTRDC